MNNDEILDKQLTNEKYYDLTDLRMNKTYNFMLSQKEVQEYLNYKDNVSNENKHEIPLFSWNSNSVYYFMSAELDNCLKDYQFYLIDDFNKNNSLYVDRNLFEVEVGIICSELEGTLNIEGINTTRRQIEKIIKCDDVTDKNSQIVLNMYKGLKYIYEKPEFTKANLKKLYDILSYDCLDKEDEIGNNFYRNDTVYIGNYEGCPSDKIDHCMDSLFNYVNDKISESKKNKIDKNIFVPFIAHYYLLYIHPYFDYNGRTARMIQIWISLLLGLSSTLYLSEAVNDSKNKYYKAIENTRNSHNDVTYFIIFMLKLSNSFYTVYKNLDQIKMNIESSGESISTSETQYLKKIILNKSIKWFNYKSFMIFANLDVTKQGALKILNGLEKKNLLISKLNSSKEKIFSLNENIIEYEIK